MLLLTRLERMRVQWHEVDDDRARDGRLVLGISARKGELENGILPLPYMLSVMRDESQPQERRDDMARAAAPYVHPRLNATELKANSEVRFVVELPKIIADTDEWFAQYRPKYLDHHPLAIEDKTLNGDGSDG